ncbi:hypothetical protein K523DRAFT_359890 [Schizophyllum commune Tattone D]|nr:hypothetical protein K523DRAFT_359890 [Schizophyllum commune Tattone D]
MSSTDVLIVGAGPSGLVTALCLVQNGLRVRVIDKLATPRRGQKGSGIQPRTLELYKELGLLDDIEERSGLPQPIVHYKLPGGTEVLREFIMIPYVEPTPDTPYSNILMLGQDRHEELLREHLERYGIKVEMSTELLEFEQDNSKVHVRIAKNGALEELDVAFVVGADGGRSTVRKLLGLDFEGETRELDKIVTGDLVVKPGLALDKWHCWGDAKSKMILLRPCEGVDSDKVAVIASGPDLDYDKVASSGKELAKAFYEISGRTDVQFGEVISLSVFRPNIRMVSKFGGGRVFLVGDAAHTHSPTGGQGMNSSVLDAANLSWKMALVFKRLAPFSLLATYSDERVPVIREMLGRTTRLLDRTMRPGENPDEGWFRGGPLFMLGIHYRWSPLAVDERREPPTIDERESAYVGAHGVCAGDRAPDAPVDGNVAQLFDLFKITHHTVLVFSEDASFVDEVAAVVEQYPKGLVDVAVVLPRGTAKGTTTKANHTLTDKDGVAYKAYEVSDDPTIVVVRPDEFIGAIVKNVDGMEKYFKRVFA